MLTPRAVQNASTPAQAQVPDKFSTQRPMPQTRPIGWLSRMMTSTVGNSRWSLPEGFRAG